MYEVVLYNACIATTVNYPSTDANTPHVISLPLTEGLSIVDILSFSININNPGYSKLFELSTKVKVIDLTDNSIRFSGRVLNIDDTMDSTGLFYKAVSCEGALSYLNDTKQRANTFLTTNPIDFLTQLLAIHNSKVDATKQIQVGNVDVIGEVAYTCIFATTLATIIAVNLLLTTGGNIKVRETNGILYLDWLQSFSGNTIDVTLGTNMADMIRSKDITSLGTRIVPLGANNLTIEAVNSGYDYIEDTVASGLYGIIEKTVTYSDITDAQALYDACLADLPNNTQPLILMESNALDLSFIAKVKADQFKLGTNLHLVNPIMALDDNTYDVVQIDMDLLQPYNPKLTIANYPLKFSTAISDLRASSIQNNGVYNNVQIGSDFGIRVVRSDGKVISTLNATDGISIENETKKVFYVDETGNIIANDATLNDVIANNMTANNGIFNNITANDGIYNNITAVNAIATLMKTSNTSSYIILHDQYIDFYKDAKKIMSIGYNSAWNNPGIRFFKDSEESYNGFEMTSSGGMGALGLMFFPFPVQFLSTATLNGSNVATEAYVQSYVASHSYTPPVTPT